jgi:glutaminyl-peptide cyclotransferase
MELPKTSEPGMHVRALLLAVAAMIPFLAGCSDTKTVAQDNKTSDNKKPRDQFAADQAKDSPPPAAFDSTRCMKYLKELCAIGPRISGSDGMKKQQALLKEHFEKLGATVTFQRFQASAQSRREPVELANMIVTWHPDRDKRILLSAHYDTRPIADREMDRRNWNRPFVSANDGTSGVAFLMELAHHVKNLALNVGVDFVIFDGEEYIHDPERDEYFFGSRQFAFDYKRTKPKHQYLAGVLLDLMAGKDANFGWEQNSIHWAASVVEDIWKTAAELGVKRFENRRGDEVLDDHLALNKAGIPTVDIIDFSYRHWHKLSDTPDKCSEETLTDLAKVLTVWAQKVK